MQERGQEGTPGEEEPEKTAMWSFRTRSAGRALAVDASIARARALRDGAEAWAAGAVYYLKVPSYVRSYITACWESVKKDPYRRAGHSSGTHEIAKAKDRFHSSRSRVLRGV